MGEHFESSQNSPKQARYHVLKLGQNPEADLRKIAPNYGLTVYTAKTHATIVFVVKNHSRKHIG